MQMCTRCHKRVAVVFITKLEKDQQVQEGFCLQCARKIGIKPVEDMLSKMGISESDIDNLSDEMTSMLSELPQNDEDEEDGGAPAIDLPKIFQNFGASFGQKKNGKNATKKQAEDKKRKFLNTYCQNLTTKAKEGKLDRIIGRDRELERVIQILCRRQKNNPCLIGEPGVGKTAIAEALAIRIAEVNVPYKLQGHEVHLLDLTALVAGTQFRGQFESRILGLINEVKEAGNIILVIDEVHNIVGAGDAEGSMNAANILKPALSRGEIQVIGATTLKEYRKHIEKDSALERRFQPVQVKEPSVEETTEMLCAIKGYYEAFYGIQIPDSTLGEAAYLAERYITDRFLPDKAIDLIDEAASRLAIDTPQIAQRLHSEKELAEIAKQRAELEGSLAETATPEETEAFYKRVADLKSKEMLTEKKLQELEAFCADLTLSEKELAKVIEIWTGIPATDISATEYQQLHTLSDRIKAKVIGQDEAVDAVCRAIKRKRAGVSFRKSPVSLIFAGPTGVGKTELVKVLSDMLFSQPDALIRLDMSEFMEKHAVSRIIGAPPGYVGYDEAGQLTEKIRRRPYSVILFDEIEKAHPDVLNILLQVLDDGHITDAAGRNVNFENAIIIMTTNAGSDKTSRISGFAENEQVIAKEKTEKALLSFLRPEFLNRIDSVITFRHLSHEDFTKIAVIMLSQLEQTLKRKGITLTYKKGVPEKIAQDTYSEKYGARNMRRYIEKNIEDEIAELVIAPAQNKITMITLALKKDKIVPYAL